MDPVTAIAVDGEQLFAIVFATLWTSLRIGALLMVAPLIGTPAVPMRVRLVLTLAISLAMTPLAGAVPSAAFDAATVLTVTRELAIGAAMGFVLKLAFEAGAIAGELMAQGTGLAFAVLADPLRGTNAGVLGTWFYLSFGLLFFALDGHLGLIELLAGSYDAVPLVGGTWDAAQAAMTVPMFFALALRVGLTLALPVMLAMLVVNLAFGVLSRAASALNPIQLGLPASLLVGLILLAALIGQILPPVQQLFVDAFTAAAAVAG